MVVKKLLITALLALAWAGNVWGARELDSPPRRSAEEYFANPSLALQDARSFFQYGDYKEAISLSKIYYGLTGKNDAAELLSQAQQCQENMEKAGIFEEQGDKASAARCYKAITDVNPNDAVALRKYRELSGTGSGGQSAAASQSVIVVTRSRHETLAVDLGLSVKWASCNLGATKPEEYGDYYAWGETEPKSNYDWSTYKFGASSSGPFSKYNTISSYGRVDNKKVLDPEDDVAHVKLGGKWRMPTHAEWTELRTKCTWAWTTLNGVNGHKVTATNGNSIFLPAAGCRSGTDLDNAGSYGDYWSSSLYTDDPATAWNVDFYSVLVYRSDGDRYYGQSVRPVTE